MATRPAVRASVVGTMAALAAFTLSGCGSNPVEDAVQNAADNAVEKAAEKAVDDAASAGSNGAGSNGDVNVDIGNDVAVPDDFPSDFPLPDGTLVAAVAIDQGMQLTYDIDDPAMAEDIAAHFASDAAFEEMVNSNVGGIQNWTYMSDEYSVTIGMIPDDPTSQMSYLVVPVTN